MILKKQFIQIVVCYFAFVQFGSAQLHIKNDAFVFASDEVVFVDGRLNIANPDSRFYLRNDAQIIQEGNSTNRGTGELSIQQNGTVHEYAYNYWCSPVGNVDVGTAGNRASRVNLIDESTGLISSTNATFTNNYSGTSTPFAISKTWLWTYVSGSEYSEWVYAGDSGDIVPGLGFTMKGTNGSSNNQLYDFRGRPNTGTITNLVSPDNFTLIGNPYPSALDAYDFIWDANNQTAINGILYFWEHDLTVNSHYVADYVGGYATYTIDATGTVETFIPAPFNTYNLDGSLNSAGASSTSLKRVKRYIPIGQGFMVRGNLLTTGTVTTDNTHRDYYKESGSESEFFRSSQTNDTLFSTIPSSYKRFRLNIDFNDTYTRQLVQTFNNNATIGFDYGMETESPEGVASDAYWTIENKPYTSQYLQFDQTSTVIPLTIKLDGQQNIRIRAVDIQYFDDSQAIYIHDMLNDTYTDLRLQNFETTIEQGIHDNRFQVVFESPETLSNAEFSNENTYIYINQAEDLLHIKGLSSQAKQVNLINMLGQTIKSYSNINNQTLENGINISYLASGTYIVSVKTENNSSIDQKIIIN